MSATRLRWEVEGRDWPHRDASRFCKVGPMTWHVQQMGEGPLVLLLHGTGASTHSWRDLMPLLAQDFSVTAIDLPGHGFTSGTLPGGPSLDNVANALGQLCEADALEPAMIVGHSAGTAIALQMVLEGRAVPVVGFNPAVMPFPGAAARLFPAMAKLLFVNPVAPRIFSRMARIPGETGRFLYRSTHSRLDAQGLRYYATLLANHYHCDGALAMMAHWHLEPLKRALPNITVPTLFVHADRDNAVPAASVREACALIPDCEMEMLHGLGHLAHEERPDQAAATIARFAARHIAEACKEENLNGPVQ